MADAYAQFRGARDFLLGARTAYDRAVGAYEPPRPQDFNWAIDWFDRVAADPTTSRRIALKLVEPDGTSSSVTYAGMSARSSQVASWLSSLGAVKGDRLLLMLGNQVELWETLLGCIKLGVVVIPATTLLTAADLDDRIRRGHVRHVIAASIDTTKFESVHGDYTRIAVGEPVAGWTSYNESHSVASEFAPAQAAGGDDTLLLYFTSGTTAEPKLVEHTHLSYPVGHLSTMYWIGLQPGDIHLNVSSPGWAKHAWSSFFAPWNAEATILVVNQSRFDAAALLETMAQASVTTFCAPPPVYRMLIQQDLAPWRERLSLRDMVGAGEPPHPTLLHPVTTGPGRAKISQASPRLTSNDRQASP